MKVETLIFIYLIICFSMIVFNCCCIFVFKYRDEKISKSGKDIEKNIAAQLNRIKAGFGIEDAHLAYLKKTLKKSGGMLAFDETIKMIREEMPEAMEKYMDSIYDILIDLLYDYNKKDETQLTLCIYVLSEHYILTNKPLGKIEELLNELISISNIYCREKVLKLLYSAGDGRAVANALATLDYADHYHNGKLITDGLLTFMGNRKELDENLWEKFEYYSPWMQVAITNYFRFSSADHKERLLEVLKDNTRDHELRYACIRYFGKHYYAEAFSTLLFFAGVQRVTRWEYSAIASYSLALYPSELTKTILMDNLHSDNWYVRYNSAQSLYALGYEYLDMLNIFEGNDRFAKEMLHYRIDRQRNREEEAL